VGLVAADMAVLVIMLEGLVHQVKVMLAALEQEHLMLWVAAVVEQVLLE